MIVPFFKHTTPIHPILSFVKKPLLEQINMSDKRKYTTYELNQCFDHMQEQLDRIENQVISTNQRVKKLEIWKARFTGALSVLTVLILPIVFMFIKALIENGI